MIAQIEFRFSGTKTSSWRRAFQWMRSPLKHRRRESKEVSVVLTIIAQPDDPVNIYTSR